MTFDGRAAAVAEWLMSADARAAARSELRRCRLPFSLVDDLIEETGVRLFVTLRRAGPVADEFDARAYGRRAMSRATLDLLRRRIRHPEEPLADKFDLAYPGGSFSVDVFVADLEDRCRRMVHTLSAGRVWAGAAALSVLSLSDAQASPPGGAPRPEAVDDVQVARWAALWAAGRLECFPGPDVPDGDAVRQRRSRAIAKVDALLAEAAALAGITVTEKVDG